MKLDQYSSGEQYIKVLHIKFSSGSSGHYFNIFVTIFQFFCSFPDPRKSPALYLLWCNVLNIDPKKEKATKPLVCEKHFSEKDLRKDIIKSKIVPKFTTRKTPRRKGKTKKRTIAQKSSAPPALEIAEHCFETPEPHEIKAEPADEITIEELSFEDVPDSSPPIKRTIFDEDVDFLESLMPHIKKMNMIQKRIFHREMMRLKMNS